MTNTSFKEWVGIVLMPKIDRAHKSHLTPEIWEETHLREVFFNKVAWYDLLLYCLPCWRAYSCPPTRRSKLLFAYILLTFDSYAQMCCKHYHMIFSTFSLKFKCKICVQKEVIHNFKNHILVGDHLQTFLFTSFSGHRPAQRECARMRLFCNVWILVSLIYW